MRLASRSDDNRGLSALQVQVSPDVQPVRYGVCINRQEGHSSQIRQSATKGRRVTGFTNGEEAAVELTDVVPFLIEDEFQRLGGRYEKGTDWAPFVVEDGTLITGQNPASSEGVAKALVARLK